MYSRPINDNTFPRGEARGSDRYKQLIGLNKRMHLDSPNVESLLFYNCDAQHSWQLALLSQLLGELSWRTLWICVWWPSPFFHDWHFSIFRNIFFLPWIDHQPLNNFCAYVPDTLAGWFVCRFKPREKLSQGHSGCRKIICVKGLSSTFGTGLIFS